MRRPGANLKIFAGDLRNIAQLCLLGSAAPFKCEMNIAKRDIFEKIFADNIGGGNVLQLGSGLCQLKDSHS